ncbi:TetR/AcrR family transcriptional regulator [Tardiphaga sp.]|jgi:AcrR family transcriptional regulator|uniref:TetR/AcrR family transcriptional regulator n=1 Tax=Tardiphaga sp. TaxID=1926292 RepID=UPI0037DA3A4C
MTTRLTRTDPETRRAKILTAARWCFLNFGFAKTSLDDIAKRATISRTLLYKTFEDKEDIFSSVFDNWLVSRHPKAKEIASGSGTPGERLLSISRLVAIEPYTEMAGAPMAAEFFDICERLDPEIDALHHRIVRECVATILEDRLSAEVFLLALDGLFADAPNPTVMKERVELLVEQFAPDSNRN